MKFFLAYYLEYLRKLNKLGGKACRKVIPKINKAPINSAKLTFVLRIVTAKTVAVNGSKALNIPVVEGVK